MRKVFVRAAALAALSGCPSLPADEARLDDAGQDASEPDMDSSAACDEKVITCEGDIALSCVAGEPARTDCAARGKDCAPNIGCATCAPDARTCDKEQTMVCAPDGTRWVPDELCTGESGVHCNLSTGTCSDLCKSAAEQNSYVGCEYWPATLANSVKKEFEYGIIVSNPQAVQASLVISADADDSGAAFSLNEVVAAGQVKTIRLPWRLHDAMSQYYWMGSAYHVTSSVPVTVYQFNPLEYRHQGDCKEIARDFDTTDNKCYSFSADASLVLPAHALRQSYMVLGYGGYWVNTSFSTIAGAPLKFTDGKDTHESTGQSVVTIIASADGKIDITPSADAEIFSEVRPAGQKFQIDGEAGTAYQLFFAYPSKPSECPAGKRITDTQQSMCGTSKCTYHIDACSGGDPSGTVVESAAPVAVYVGAPCAFVPFNREACDHIEESLPPKENWGTSALVAATKPLKKEKNLFRIISGVDGNKLTFQPLIHAPITLQAGQLVELESSESFKVTGSGALLVAQFLVGQNYGDTVSDDTQQIGDPSLTYVSPVEQFRSTYDFLSPDTYDQSWAMLTAPAGSTVRLDGKKVDDWQPIADTGFGVAHVKLVAGAHSVAADKPVGLQVYGFGDYTSYMFPGGLDLRKINLF